MNETNWSLEFEKRFWSKVLLPQDLVNDCWIWQGRKDRKGYGRIYVYLSKHSNVLSHRLSFEYFHGVHLTSDIFVCHKCDVRDCVNPNHLFPGDRESNQRDQIQKGRTVKGSINGRAVLTEDDVLELRKMYSTGKYNKQTLADFFGIGWTACNHAIKRNTWNHI